MNLTKKLILIFTLINISIFIIIGQQLWSVRNQTKTKNEELFKELTEKKSLESLRKSQLFIYSNLKDLQTNIKNVGMDLANNQVFKDNLKSMHSTEINFYLNKLIKKTDDVDTIIILDEDFKLVTNTNTNTNTALMERFLAGLVGTRKSLEALKDESLDVYEGYNSYYVANPKQIEDLGLISPRLDTIILYNVSVIPNDYLDEAIAYAYCIKNISSDNKITQKIKKFQGVAAGIIGDNIELNIAGLPLLSLDRFPLSFHDIKNSKNKLTRVNFSDKVFYSLFSKAQIDENGKEFYYLSALNKDVLKGLENTLLKNERAGEEKLLAKLFWTFLLVILITIISTILVARNVSGPILNLAHITEEITKGNFDVESTYDRTDEIGNLSNGINRMAITLSTYKIETELMNSINEAALQFGLKTRGLSSFTETADVMVQFLGNLLEVPIINIYRGVPDDVEFVCGIGIDENGYKEFSESALVSQAIKTKEPIIIRDVPASYSEFSTASISGRPTQVRLIPILHEGIVVAVLEIGLCEDISSVKESILKEIMNYSGQLLASMSTQEQVQLMLLEATKLGQELIENQQELEKKASDLERSNEYKSQFLANMSHEIRTPMNGIMGFTQIILDSDLDDEQRNSANIVNECCDSLLVIIDDILDLSKIEADMFELELTPFNLEETVFSCINIVYPKLKSESVVLLADVGDIWTPVLGDPGRLKQILINLLGNSIKFTHKGEITLKCKTVNETDSDIQILFSVQDTGIGMSEEQQGTIFDAFTQADGSTTRKYGGTGLGLNISSKLIGLMGSKIELESELGTGSTFSFFLTLKKSMDGHKPNTTIKSLSGKYAVVLDDKTNFNEILCTIVEKTGMKSVPFLNAQDALNYVENHKVDLVVVDMEQLPDLEQFFEELNSDKRFNGITIGIGADMKSCSLSHKENNRCGFLQKPLSYSGFFEMLKTLGINPNDTENEQAVYNVEEAAIVKNSENTFTELKILMVEDNKINQKLQYKMLSNMGHKVTIANDGLEALEMIRREDYDLVFMDMQMPNLNGLDATKEIRKLNIDTPIIALTANAYDEDRRLCIESGMDAFVAKPITRNKITDAIVKVITNESDLASSNSLRSWLRQQQ
ncbi:MAG: response regulator [Lentisphaeria bacterium]|nr:response regulator [Lentisphaeria bacterium]